MKINIAICTWNRAPLLDQTLEHLAHISIPEGVAWEVLVVNNRCTDNTDEVIKRHQERMPLRRLYEETSGVSFARNLAIESAGGDYLMWIDDDVIVDPDWATHYLEAIEQYPNASFFGGKVDPLYEVEPPPWVLRHLKKLSATFALKDYGPGTREFTTEEIPMGANVMMPLAVLKEHQYNTKVGSRGDDNLRGEDPDLFRRFHQLGMQGIWVAPARVQHFIPKHRLTLKFVWEWWHGMGRSYRIRFGLQEGRMLGDAPAWAWREYLEKRALSALYRPSLGDRWVAAYTRAAYLKGFIQESRTQAALSRQTHSEQATVSASSK